MYINIYSILCINITYFNIIHNLNCIKLLTLYHMVTTAVNNKCTYYHAMIYCTLRTSVENDSLMMATTVSRNM
jgi:hypothetical protein